MMHPVPPMEMAIDSSLPGLRSLAAVPITGRGTKRPAEDEIDILETETVPSVGNGEPETTRPMHPSGDGYMLRVVKWWKR